MGWRRSCRRDPPRRSLWRLDLRRLELRGGIGRRRHQGEGSGLKSLALQIRHAVERLVERRQWSRGGRQWRRAAKLYGIAAEHYRRGGLGLRAIAARKGAAKCFEAIKMPDDHERCRLKSISIPVYYGCE